MAGEKRFTRIPPSSTGAAVAVSHVADISFKNGGTNISALYGNHQWKIDEIYTIAGFGDVVVRGVYDKNDGTGWITVKYTQSELNENSVPPLDALISYDGTNVGQVALGDNGLTYLDRSISQSNVVGYDNPEFGWNIDRFGSGQVTFSEGQPQVAALGALKVNDAQLIAAYDFSKSNLPSEFVNSREGGSDVSNSWDPSTRAVKLAIGTTAGDRVTQTSTAFHSYEEGVSMLYLFSARSGPAQQFTTRLWGCFDATDGFFFQIKGDDDNPGGRTTPVDPVGTGPGSALRIVHRFTFNGTTNNHEILQKEWNRDTLLGTGGVSNPSSMNLDFEKVNTYWIDYQFIGGGRTRWGVFYLGQRIVVHEMYHHNGIGIGTQFTHPISNPNRPVCFATANYGTAGTSSEFYAYGAGVFIEGAADPLRTARQISIAIQNKMWGEPEQQPYWRTKQSKNGSSSNFPALLKSGSYSSHTSTQYATTVSPDQFLLNPDGSEGDENHTVYQPLLFNISNLKISDESRQKAEVRVFYNCNMRGVEFQSNKPSTPTTSYDVDGDHVGHIIEIGRDIIDGLDTFDFSKLSDNFQYGTVRNTSDQDLARQLQPITEWLSADDKYSTGVDRVKVTIGPHPIYGVSRHFFNDKQPISIREVDGDQDLSVALAPSTTFTNIKTAGGAGYSSVDKIDNPSDWHFMSMVSRDEAWLYSSQADIDEDRLTRVLTVDDCSSTDLGQAISVGGSNAFVLKINVDDTNADSAGAIDGVSEYQIIKRGATDYTTIGAANNDPGTIFTSTGTLSNGQTGTAVLTSNSGTIAICGRNDSSGGYVGSFTTHADSVGTPTLGSGTVSSVATDASLAKDYWTSLNALTYTDLGMDADVDTSSLIGPTYTGLALYGTPPPRAAWTFMIKHLQDENEDEDGDIGPNKDGNNTNNWNIFWRERKQ